MTSTISWHDLTVDDADSISDFYCRIAGWTKEPYNMGDYSDYVMKDAAGNVTGGICNARGSNKDIPPVWLCYITVSDLDKSLEACTAAGGQVAGSKKTMGEQGTYCLIRDPAGAYVMLWENNKSVK
jgi:uncharacterized protein